MDTISLVDVSDNAGDLSRISKELADAVGDTGSADNSTVVRQTQSVGDDEDNELPVKLRGKSRKEIAEMYGNLESSHGRMANELGTQRSLTDRLLDLKRTTDLGVNTPAPKAKITRDEILADDPTPSIERLIDARLKPLTDALEQRLSQLAGNAAESTFVAKHPDFNQIAGDPEFAKWIQSSTVRTRTAGAAKAGDWNAADDLLTDYKAERQSKTKQRQENNEVDLEGARRASIETGTSVEQARGQGKGKVYRREDLIKLRMDDAERYYSDEFQSVILKAYAEGRVK